MKYDIPAFQPTVRGSVGLLIFQLLLNYHRLLIMVAKKYKKLGTPSILIIN